MGQQTGLVTIQHVVKFRRNCPDFRGEPGSYPDYSLIRLEQRKQFGNLIALLPITAYGALYLKMKKRGILVDLAGIGSIMI